MVPPALRDFRGIDVIVISCNRGHYLEGVAAYFVDSGQLAHTNKTNFDSKCV